jgi:predicted NAD/FAD-binding protein
VQKRKIAIVGAGISGLGAAWALKKSGFDLTIYEASNKVGGHMGYYELEKEGKIERFDGYPGILENSHNLIALCSQLGVETHTQQIGFYYQNEHHSWGSTHHTSFFKNNEVECARFISLLTDLMERDATMEASAQTFEDFLNYHGFSEEFGKHIVTPLLGALMDTDYKLLMKFSPASFAELFGQKILSFDKPFNMVRFLHGISTMIEGLVAFFKDDLLLNTGVVELTRTDDYVQIIDTSKKSIRFDDVIMTTNFKENLKLISDMSIMEKNIFGGVEYLSYKQLFHADNSFIPSFFVKDGITEIIVNEMGSTTSPMANSTRTQFDDVLITAAVNDINVEYTDVIDEKKIVSKNEYLLEKISPASILAKSNIRHIQGHNNTWYSGLSVVPGLSEYCFVSGLAVAERLGAKYPFEDVKEAEAIFKNVKRLMFTGHPSLRFS